MPTNLLLLPLLGGYWFIHTLSYTRIRSQALDGYRLLLESAIAGMGFATFARVLVLCTATYLPCIQSLWFRVAPNYPYLGTAVLAALVGFALAYPLNQMLEFTGILPASVARKRAVDKGGSQIHIILQVAANEEKPIAITLDNRKVYIGIVTGVPSLRPTDTSLSMIPWLSGYREVAAMNLIFTVNYLRVYQEQQVNQRDFVLAMPLSSIRTVGFFDPSIYPAFVVEEDEETPEAGTATVAGE